MVPQPPPKRQRAAAQGATSARRARMVGRDDPPQGVASKRFAATFLRTASGRQIRPFIAM